MTERDLFDAIGRLPERFRTEAMELPANTADKTALIQAGSSEAIHSTDAAIRQHKTEKPFSGKLRYLAVVASAAACIAGVVGIMHLHGGSDDDIFVAESVVTDVREEAPETETEPVQTTVTSEAEEILTVRTTEKAVTTAKAVTTGKQQGSTAQQTGTTAAAAVQNSRTTAQQTTAATAQRTTAAPRQTTTTGTTAAQPCTTTQSATTTVCTTTASRDVNNSLYPGPNYHIILRPVAYFSDDAAWLTDAEMTTLNWQGENEIQYLSEILVTYGTLVDPSTDADIPAGDAAYTIKGAAGHTYFEESDLNTDIDLYVHNSSDVRLPTDKDVSGIIGFRTMTRNIIHVQNHLGIAQPDERDTDIRPYSNPEVTYYMYANSNCSDYQDDPFNPNRAYNVNSAYNKILVYNKALSSGAGLPSTSITYNTVTVRGNRENPYTQSSKTGETFYDGVVIEYNVLTGEMRVSQSLQQGEPIPQHPMPN